MKFVKEVKVKLDGGVDFVEIVKKYFEDIGFVEKGGLYEDIFVVSWVDVFKEVVKILLLNKISDFVEIEYGYYIMKVEKCIEVDYMKLIVE